MSKYHFLFILQSYKKRLNNQRDLFVIICKSEDIYFLFLFIEIKKYKIRGLYDLYFVQPSLDYSIYYLIKIHFHL